MQAHKSTPSAKMVSVPASSSASSSNPPRQEQPTIDSSAPLACLQVLQSAVTLASMPAEGVCQIMKGMVATQGQGTTAAMQALRALRDALDEVLEDGQSDGGERKRKRVTACLDDNEMQSADSTTTTFTADRFAACAQVLHNTNLLTSIIGWLFHEHHTLHQPANVLLAAACAGAAARRRSQ